MAIEEVDWPEGWFGIDGPTARVFERQLALELGADHALAPAIARGDIRAIGRFGGSDDVVYALDGWKAPFAVVHLAWPPPDERPWLLRKLRPRPASRWLPALMPLDALADLASWFD